MQQRNRNPFGVSQPRLVFKTCNNGKDVEVSFNKPWRFSMRYFAAMVQNANIPTREVLDPKGLLKAEEAGK